MLCSKCSIEVSPIVAIDIDGTLGDYHGHFERFAAAYLGRDTRAIPYGGEVPHSEWFCRAYGVDLRTFRDIKLAYRQGAQKRSMPIYDGAQDLINTCFQAGAEIWLTTTRPYLRLDNIDPDTRAWLERHDIYFDGLLYHEQKYEWLHEHVDPSRVVAVLDDLPDMYDAVGEMFGYRVPILRRTKYNRNVERAMSARSLLVAARYIAIRINHWKAAASR